MTFYCDFNKKSVKSATKKTNPRKKFNLRLTLGGVDLPVEDLLDIGLLEGELVAVSDSALEENSDRDWELGY